MWRQNILLKPTDTELPEEADCTHKLPGAGRAVGETGQPLVRAQALRPGQSRSGACGGGALSSLRNLSFWFSSKGLRPEKKPMTDYKNKNN